MMIYDVIMRKLIASFVATTISSIIMGALSANDQQYELGNAYVGWTMLFSMYVGAIVFLYGNTVSLSIEYAQTKWFKKNNVVYIMLHGLFGLASAIVFKLSIFTLAGILTALLYAWIDRIVYTRSQANKGILPFLLAPFLLFGTFSGYYAKTSPPLPPFTAEDAVEFATSGEGTIVDLFPNKVGIWEGKIGVLDVVRETSVKKIGDETYIVTFTETWSNENANDKWTSFTSYKVKRGTLTIHRSSGPQPPYYRK